MKKLQYLSMASAFALLLSCNNDKTEKNVAPNNTAVNPAQTVADTNKAATNKTETTNTVNNTNAGTTEEKEKTYVIDYRAMGAIKLNMPKADVLNLFPNAKLGIIIGEMNIPCLDVMDKDGSLLYKVGIEDGKTVSVIITSNTKMKTVSGIAVGSTLTQAKKIYPDIKVSMIEGEWVAFAEKRFMSFTLNGSGGDAKVTEIYVN
jgi:hypothetical protein